MKKIISFLVFNFVFLQFVSSQQNDKGAFVGNFEYGVLVNQSDLPLKWAATRWYCNIIENRDFANMLMEIAGGIKSGKIKAKKSAGNENYMTVAEAEEKLKQCNTIYMMDSLGLEGYEKYVCDYLDFQEDVYIKFHEDWYYNSASNILTKEVKGIDIGNWSREKRAFAQQLYISFSPEKFSRANFNFYGTYCVANAGQGIAADANFHFFKNKLMAKAEKDHSLLRDTLFPFMQQIPPEKFGSATDSIGKCFNYGFYEDWSFDSENLAFTKKTMAIGFYRNPEFSTASVKSRGVFVFNNFRMYRPENGVQDMGSQQSSQNTVDPSSDSVSKNDSINFAAIQRFADKIISKVEKDGGAVASYYPGDSTVYLTPQQLQERFEYEVQRIATDSLGNEFVFVDKLVNKTVQALNFYQNPVFDFAKNKIKRSNKFVSLCRYDFNKGFYIPVFGIILNSDSGYVPVEDDIVCRNIQSRTLFLSDNYFTEAVVSDPAYETRVNIGDMPLRNKFEFFLSLFGAAQAGKINLYQPGTDSVLTPRQIAALKDTLTLQSLGKTELPTFFLPVTEMRYVEDWFYNEKRNIFFTKTKEVTFFRKSESNMDISLPLFSIKFK